MNTNNFLVSCSAIALVIVLVIIIYWYFYSREGMKVGKVVIGEHNKSDWGQGVKNMELKRNYEDLKKIDGYKDYNEVIKYASLEPSVFDSHQNYSNELGITNTGASAMAVRSDPNDVVQWVGLRRPDYSASSMGDVRTDHSEFPDQMRENSNYLI